MIHRLLLFLSVALWLSNPVLQADDAKPTNVLFLICDDLNCDIGCYGHPLVKTPNIDRLAQRGVRFDRAYCQYPLCGPSRASFMTGLYPDQTLIHRNAIYVREHLPDVNTMSQMFRDAGYTATRIGKIYHYNVPKHIGTSGHDDPYSWNVTINPQGRDVHEEDKIFSLIPGSFGGTLSWLAADGTDAEQTDGIAAAEADQVLKSFAQSGTPFFLAVGLYRPHTPYVAPKKYFDMYPRNRIAVPQVPQNYLNTIPAPAKKSLTRKVQNNLDDDVARQAIQAYYASITFADAQVGHILDSLQSAGLADNTVIVFTSDHGYHMGEHGHYQKTTLYENAARVPLIMAGPGITATGQTASTLAEMVDFYPTLAELTGLKTPDYVSGLSLMPALKDASAVVRDSAYTQYDIGYSLRTDRYRYTEWGTDGVDGAELYDHETDAAEMVNLAGSDQHQQVMNELAAKLRDRIRQHRQPPQGLKQIVFENRRVVPQRTPKKKR
ncbi:MAG: sulfatase [Planctomycetaceae bacterium]